MVKVNNGHEFIASWVERVGSTVETVEQLGAGCSRICSPSEDVYGSVRPPMRCAEQSESGMPRVLNARGEKSGRADRWAR